MTYLTRAPSAKQAAVKAGAPAARTRNSRPEPSHTRPRSEIPLAKSLRPSPGVVKQARTLRRQRCETRGRCKAGLACATIDRHRQSAACVACVPTRLNRREPSGRPLSGGSNARPLGEEGRASGQRPRNAAPQPDTARPVSGGREDRLPSSSLPPSAAAQAEIRIPNALACAPASEYGLPPWRADPAAREIAVPASSTACLPVLIIPAEKAVLFPLKLDGAPMDTRTGHIVVK